MSESLKCDVILQGPMHDGTYDYARFYANLPTTNQVIISTWDGERVPTTDPRIKVVFSEDPANPGQNNRNRQIISTQAGLAHCTAPIVVKTRTDQHIRGNSWHTMFDYFAKNYRIEEKFLDFSGPKGAIFAIGLYRKFVFHPQDHLFFGWLEDMVMLFSLPLDTVWPRNLANPGDNAGTYSDWAHTDLRPNAYIGMHYYAKFDERIKYMVEHPQDFIVDEARFRDEALAKDAQYRDKIFKVFPILDVYWSKYGRTYPYEWGVPFTEYHA